MSISRAGGSADLPRAGASGDARVAHLEAWVCRHCPMICRHPGWLWGRYARLHIGLDQPIIARRALCLALRFQWRRDIILGLPSGAPVRGAARWPVARRIAGRASPDEASAARSDFPEERGATWLTPPPAAFLTPRSGPARLWRVRLRTSGRTAPRRRSGWPARQAARNSSPGWRRGPTEHRQSPLPPRRYPRRGERPAW